MTSANFKAAFGRLQPGGGHLRRGPGQGHKDALGAVAQLGIGGLEIDHEVAVGLP